MTIFLQGVAHWGHSCYIFWKNMQGITPKVHSFHMSWHKFLKGDPLDAVSATWSVSDSSIYSSCWNNLFWGVFPLNRIYHIGCHVFLNGLPLKALYDTLYETIFLKGNLSSGQICHMWCHMIFQVIIFMIFFLKYGHTFCWFPFGFYFLSLKDCSCTIVFM